MAEAIPPSEITNKPDPDAELKATGYMLGLTFHPPVKLDRKKGFEFAALLSDFIDPQNAQLSDQSWIFGQQAGDSATGGLQIAILPNQIQCNFSQLSHALEWVEHRSEDVFRSFEKRFKPKLVLNSAASYEGILPINGDARSFLAARLMHVSKEQLDMFGRPLQLLGLRFFLPAFKLENKSKGTKKTSTGFDWSVEVRTESLLEDASKLFIQATANWGEPKTWTKETVKEMVSHLATVSEYVKNDVINFLEKATEEESI